VDFDCRQLFGRVSVVMDHAHRLIDYLSLAENLTTIRYGSSLHNSGGNVVKAGQFVIHPDYNRAVMHHDIALINTMTAMDGNLYGKDASLPPANVVPPFGSTARASGWGYPNSATLTISNELMSIRLPILPTYEECHKKFADLGFRLICSNIVCAADLGFADSGLCGRGDAGSPLVDANSKLIGLGSFSYSCGHTNYPNVFTQVAAYVGWISCTTGLSLTELQN